MDVRFDTHFDTFACCFGAPRFDYTDRSNDLASIPWSLLGHWSLDVRAVASTLARINLLASMLLARMLARVDTWSL